MRSALTLFTFVLLLTCLLQQASSETYFIDPGVRLVESYEGWGTSLAWWADVLGGMPKDVIKQITEGIFSESGLHLNIVRYTIGGTTPGQYACGPYRPGGATESFQDGPNLPYNWTRDARQRRILAISKELGVDTFEAFSNSPPQWMTISGCSKGNPGGGLLHSNFNSSRASEYATYIADVLEHFKNDWGIDFQSYAPFNEPYGLLGICSWDGTTSRQEGCCMDRATMTEVIRQFYATFRSRNISTVLSVSDETQIDTAVNVQNYFREHNVTQLAGKVNVHGYWDSQLARRDVLYSNTMKDGLRLWMDEMGWAGTPPTDMTQGLNLARRIVKDIRDLLPSAWVYWQAMEDVGLWGLIDIPYDNATVANIAYNSGFYSFMQFTKFIRKGSTIIYVNEPNTIAAHDPKTNNLVLVTVNPSEDQLTELNYNLELFDSLGTATARRASPVEQFRDVSTEILFSPTIKTLAFIAPPESITTVVIQNATLINELALITDGNFEGSPTAWNFSGNAGLSPDFPWLGAFSGYVRNGSISQSIRVVNNGAVFLSARCSSNGGNALLSLAVNEKVFTVPVTSRQYTSYGISGYAYAGDIVTITFSATSASYIDNVSLNSNPNSRKFPTWGKQEA